MNGRVPHPALSPGLHALPVRLQPGDDLRAALLATLGSVGADAAFVIAGIGSLGPACIRFAAAAEATMLDGEFEILTLSGTRARDVRTGHDELAITRRAPGRGGTRGSLSDAGRV